MIAVLYYSTTTQDFHQILPQGTYIIYNLNRVTLYKNRFMIGFITSTKIIDHLFGFRYIKEKVVMITPFNKTLNKKSVIDFISITKPHSKVSSAYLTIRHEVLIEQSNMRLHVCA